MILMMLVIALNINIDRAYAVPGSRPALFRSESVQSCGSGKSVNVAGIMLLLIL